MEMDWSEIVQLMEVSAILYKYTYCIFTLYCSDWLTCLTTFFNRARPSGTAATCDSAENIKHKVEKKNLKLNGHREYFGIYFSWWNHLYASKWFILTEETQNLVNLKCVTTTHSCPLKHVQQAMIIISSSNLSQL